MSKKPFPAGPELDAAVARALGWDFTIDQFGGVVLLARQSKGLYACNGKFEPSTCIETAFVTAKIAGLFTWNTCLTEVPDAGWFFDSITGLADQFENPGCGNRGAKTPEVALCWGIIDKFSKKPT